MSNLAHSARVMSRMTAIIAEPPRIPAMTAVTATLAMGMYAPMSIWFFARRASGAIDPACALRLRDFVPLIAPAPDRGPFPLPHDLLQIRFGSVGALPLWPSKPRP